MEEKVNVSKSKLHRKFKSLPKNELHSAICDQFGCTHTGLKQKDRNKLIHPMTNSNKPIHDQ